MEGGKEANYWPGFVDAFANVIVTMVFVMVVFVIALLYFSQNKAKEAIAVATREIEERVTKDASAAHAGQALAEQAQAERDALAQENARLAEALKKSQEAAAAAKREAAAAAAVAASATQASARGSVTPGQMEVSTSAQSAREVALADARVSGNQSAVEITFPNGTFELDKESQARLEAAFSKMANRVRSDGIELLGVAEAGPYSEGRRLSYYRNMALRNWLIAKGVPPDKIRVKIAERSSGRKDGLVQMTVPGR